MARIKSGLCIVAMLCVLGSSTTLTRGEAENDFAAAARLFQADRWQEAATAYERISGEQPNSAFVWFRLGYLYRKLGDLEKAATAFERSGEIARYADPNVIRMLTEISIEMGDADKALYWLDRFVGIGLRPDAMTTRPEFSSLRGQPRFQDLVHQAESNDRKCDNPEARQFDFWIGDWDVANHHRVQSATDRVETILNGCVIIENYAGFRGNHAKSFSYYDAERGKWRQSWLTDDGKQSEFVGEFRDGAMSMTGEISGSDGSSFLSRMTWRPQDDGSVHQVFENSHDKGESWYVLFELNYTPRAN